MTEITIASKISLQEFRNYSIQKFFKSRQTILLVISLLGISTLSVIGIMPILFVQMSFLIIVTIPVYLFFKASKTYKSAQVLNEELIFTFEEEYLNLKGSFIDKKIKLDDVLKIDWEKSFVMVYLNERLALFINQKNIEASGKSQELKTLIDKISAK